MARTTNNLSSEITPRDFGKLEAQVENLTNLVIGVDQKVSGVMTRSEFTDWTGKMEVSHQKIDDRLDALEDINKLRSQSIWSRIGMAADASFVSFVGKAIFILFGALFATYFLSNYQLAPKADEPVTTKGVENG